MNIYQLPDNQPDLYSLPVIPELTQDESLQLSAEWFENRKGRFTGSEIHKLMSCTNASKGYEWGRPEKVIDFGEIAKKYVFSKAKERQRNKVIRLSIGKNGDFGREVEPAIFEMLEKKYPSWKFEKVGFIEFIEGIAGASPDGLIESRIGLEIKAAMTWDTVYSRHEIPFDQKHQDFWQINSEMLALEVDEVMYVVSEPPEDINNPEIENLSIKYVESSPIHQNAIKQRCMIGDVAIKLWLDGCNFQESIRIACSEFKF